MDKKVTYAIIAILLVVVVAGVAYVAISGDDSSEPEEDTYYFFLDGYGDDVNKWYSATGSNPLVAFEAAMKDGEVPYEIDEKGYFTSINGISDDKENKKFIGTYMYTSTSLENAKYNFITGPVLKQINSNIIYITYSGYQFTYDLIYDLNPTNSTAKALFTEGPFASDANYKPLDYSGKFSFFIDGMGDINGWYEAEGKDIVEAFDSAMKDAKIDYKFRDDGFLESLGTNVSDDSKSFTMYTYLKNTIKDGSAYDFKMGPVFEDIAGSIVYISYGAWVGDNSMPTPTTTTNKDFMSSGPLAVA